METNSPEGEPTPELPLETPNVTAVPDAAAEVAVDEPAPEAAVTNAPPGEAVAPDELTQLAEASQKARLSPVEEERMAALLKEALLGGRGGVARAIDVLPKVPWIVGVRAVETVWPELTSGFRTQLLSGLGKEETDAARRIRLSLARALFKIDVPVALKLATAVARELRDKETGILSAKSAQIFANVFIGRGKPWLAQLPMADLKPGDIDVLVDCAVLAVFTVPHPPVTQLGVLKWTKDQERLEKLETPALELVKKGVGRWSAKWQNALRKEVAELPEVIASVLKPVPEAGASPELSEEGAESTGEAAPSDEAPAAEDEAEADEDEDDDEDEVKERPVYEPRPQKPASEATRERPVYTPRSGGGNVPRNFNLTETLRNIEAYAQSLRSELATAQSKLRQKEDRRREEKAGPIIPGEPTPEELARLNVQLEARNAELQERITELTQHSEDVAVSSGVLAGEPVQDGAAQLRTLLALKLQEDFADFLALETESHDLVVQQHYRGLLQHVFEVLQQLEVPLKPAAE